MYRPTVRYDDRYKKYVDQIFKATNLDRNQIIRLALFAAPFSPLFQHQLEKYMTSPLPTPIWEVTDHGLWMEQTFEKRREGRSVVNGNHQEISTTGERPAGSSAASVTNRSAKGREGEIYQQKVIKQSGGITIKIG